jgi:hypothetical protein
MGIFSRKSKDDLKKAERESLIAVLKTASANGNDMQVFATFMNLTSGHHLGAPDVPYIVNGVIEAAVRRDWQIGIGMATYCLNMMDEPAMREMLVTKTLSLISRSDRGNMRQMASVAMASQLVVTRSGANAEARKRGMSEWNAAVDILSSKKDGLGFAFAAASNAALGHDSPDDLARNALDKWEKAVLKTAKTSKSAAFNEVSRVTKMYYEFGARGGRFRDRAMETIYKIASLKP